MNKQPGQNDKHNHAQTCPHIHTAHSNECPVKPSAASCPYHGKSNAATNGPAARRTASIAAHLFQAENAYQEQTSVLPFEAIPGPRTEDERTYRTDNHAYLMRLHDQYGDVFRIIRRGKPVVFVRSADLVRRVLLSEDDFDKTFDADHASTPTLQYLMNIMQPLLKTAEVFKSTDNHQHRFLLKSIFNASDVFAPGFLRVVRATLETWPTHAKHFDTLRASHHLVFAAVMVIIMGENQSYTKEFYDEATNVLEHFEQRYSKPMFDVKINEEDEAVMARLEAAGLAVVKEFRRRIGEGTQTLPGQSEEITKRSMLYTMMQVGSGHGGPGGDAAKFSDEEICGTMINTLLAASEGPASGLSTTMYDLVRNPEVQERFGREVRSLAQQFTGADYLNELLENQYVHGTVLEGLRMKTPVAIVQRRAMHDTTVGSYAVPKGTIIGVCIAAVHKDKNQFSCPHQFDPLRSGLDHTFLDREQCFMTFSGGPRGCPGRHLAVTLLKIAASSIVDKYRLVDTDQPQDIPGKVYKFVEWHVGGLFVELQQRP
mmetsp:Transcript_18109/g.26550  ORF Transcript_18109/g.26550 Transcript_18109/m.26550 type:complete len:542 (-) Transcript_18109:65-1690(-)